jgi:hypothetical protein
VKDINISLYGYGFFTVEAKSIHFAHLVVCCCDLIHGVYVKMYAGNKYFTTLFSFVSGKLVFVTVFPVYTRICTQGLYSDYISLGTGFFVDNLDILFYFFTKSCETSFYG